MISHKHKCIFVHIPKTAGSSINRYISGGKIFDWKTPNYEVLYGYCPKRQIHLQHATVKQLLETELISEDLFNTYFKFTFIRNAWDRSYSDYHWMMNDTGIKDNFENFINKSGRFTKVLNDNSTKYFRGDHLLNQSDFFDTSGSSKLDFVGSFENISEDLLFVLNRIGASSEKDYHEKKKHKKKVSRL